jgi:hypothetical protein
VATIGGGFCAAGRPSLAAHVYSEPSLSVHSGAGAQTHDNTRLSPGQGRAVLFDRGKREPELLLQVSRTEKSPRTVWRCHPIALATPSTGVYIIAGTAMTPWLWLDPLGP